MYLYILAEIHSDHFQKSGQSVSKSIAVNAIYFVVRKSKICLQRQKYSSEFDRQCASGSNSHATCGLFELVHPVLCVALGDMLIGAS